MRIPNALSHRAYVAIRETKFSTGHSRAYVRRNAHVCPGVTPPCHTRSYVKIPNALSHQRAPTPRCQLYRPAHSRNISNKNTASQVILPEVNWLIPGNKFPGRVVPDHPFDLRRWLSGAADLQGLPTPRCQLYRPATPGQRLQGYLAYKKQLPPRNTQ